MPNKEDQIFDIPLNKVLVKFERSIYTVEKFQHPLKVELYSELYK